MSEDEDTEKLAERLSQRRRKERRWKGPRLGNRFIRQLEEDAKKRGGEKIENLLHKVESLKKSGQLSSDEEKELRALLDKAIRAYESGNYEKSLRLGRKTEKYTD